MLTNIHALYKIGIFSELRYLYVFAYSINLLSWRHKEVQRLK